MLKMATPCDVAAVSGFATGASLTGFTSIDTIEDEDKVASSEIVYVIVSVPLKFNWGVYFSVLSELIETAPLMAETALTVRTLLSSTSVSLANTLMLVMIVSSKVVVESGLAIGASLTGLTSIDMVDDEIPPFPSDILYNIMAEPEKFGRGVYCIFPEETLTLPFAVVAEIMVADVEVIIPIVKMENISCLNIVSIINIILLVYMIKANKYMAHDSILQ
jgi:hypothetical protein